MYLHLMLCCCSFVTEPETRYLNLEPSAAMNGGFVALLKRQVKAYLSNVGYIFELTMTRIFARFMVIFIVVPLLFAKQKLPLPTRSKLIDREIKKLWKPP